MPGSPPSIEQTLARLAATPQRIAALTAGAGPADLRTSPGDDAWSANDVLAHLRACADVWGGCAELLVLLAPLSPADWSRAARVTGAGKPLERTVRSYAEWLASHERPYVRQIERVVATLRAGTRPSAD